MPVALLFRPPRVSRSWTTPALVLARKACSARVGISAPPTTRPAGLSAVGTVLGTAGQGAKVGATVARRSQNSHDLSSPPAYPEVRFLSSSSVDTRDQRPFRGRAAARAFWCRQSPSPLPDSLNGFP